MQTSRTNVGVDTAKCVFRLYWVDTDTGYEMNVRLGRKRFLRRCPNRLPCLVAMVAEEGLTTGRGNKNDARDTRATWLPLQRPRVRILAVKTGEQQKELVQHRIRDQFVHFRNAQVDCLSGLLAEDGQVIPPGRAGLKRNSRLVLGGSRRVRAATWRHA